MGIYVNAATSVIEVILTVVEEEPLSVTNEIVATR
jgi:hypothetical protein